MDAGPDKCTMSHEYSWMAFRHFAQVPLQQGHRTSSGPGPTSTKAYSWQRVVSDAVPVQVSTALHFVSWHLFVAPQHLSIVSWRVSIQDLAGLQQMLEKRAHLFQRKDHLQENLLNFPGTSFEYHGVNKQTVFKIGRLELTIFFVYNVGGCKWEIRNGFVLSKQESIGDPIKFNNPAVKNCSMPLAWPGRVHIAQNSWTGPT